MEVQRNGKDLAMFSHRIFPTRRTPDARSRRSHSLHPCTSCFAH